MSGASRAVKLNFQGILPGSKHRYREEQKVSYREEQKVSAGSCRAEG